jgi:DNA polymerase III sliding clamp (beta) subunit (PCNA family)
MSLPTKALRYFTKNTRTGIISQNTLRVTDLDYTLILDMPGETRNALFDVKLFYKTGDIDAAIQAAGDQSKINDYPATPTPSAPTTTQNADVLSDLPNLVPTCSTDISRTVLGYIFIDAKNSTAVATDGHVLFTQKNNSNTDLLIHPDVLSILKYLVPKTIEVSEKQYIISGDGFKLITKNALTTISPYPNYKQVIPDYPKCTPITWSAAQQDKIRSFIKTVLPFIDKRTNMIVISDNKLAIKNEELHITKVLDFNETILPVAPDNILGFNAKFLLKVLDFVDGKPVKVTCGRAISGIKFTGSDFFAIQMPLRTKDKSDDFNTLTDYLKTE